MAELEEMEDESENSRFSIGYNQEILSPLHRDEEQPTLIINNIIDNTENDYYRNKMFGGN